MLQVAAMQNAQSASTRSTTGSDDDAPLLHDPFVLDHSGTVMNEDMYALA